MKKIDWYILRKFLTTFFFAIFLFTVIAVVVDVSEKTDEMVRSRLGVKRIILEYYIGFVPHIIALLFPLFVFISVIYFTSKMAVQSEIIAVIAGGTSYGRWLRPYWVGSIFLAMILWLANQYVVPRANKIRSSFESKYIDANSSYNALVGGNTHIYFRVDSSTYAGIMRYDTLIKRGGPLFMYRFANQRLQENMRAESIVWDTATKKWRLELVVNRQFGSLGEKVTLMDFDNRSYNFTPQDLGRDKYTKERLTTPELNRFIALEKLRGSEGLNELLVERYRRDATVVTVILLTLIGAIIAGRKVRGGSGIHLAMGFMLAAFFIVADRFSTIFSTKGNLPPLLAAWIPNLLFLGVVIYLYRRAPK